MSTIQILPPHIANKIAAGEVVERPASVVKELLENAIDAEARRIRVDLGEGGKRLIRVTDDGRGMDREDLELAVERHATSKIRHESDMATVRTLGFRGEALPSIAAVSRFSIVSRPEAALEGWAVRVVFGKGKTVTAVGCPAGTAVEVEDLFLEIPARLSFLRARQTEMGHVSLIVRTLAVGHPEILFELLSEGKALFRSHPNCQRPECLAYLLGERLSSGMLPVQGTGGGIEVSGYVAPPGEARASSRAFYFFLNRRPITNRLLWRALHEAGRGHLMKNAHPAGVLFLDVEPDLVDINVHPTKQDVRFKHSDTVYRAVYHAVRRAFEGAGSSPDLGSARGFQNHAADAAPPAPVRTHTVGPLVAEQPAMPWGGVSRRSGEEASDLAAGPSRTRAADLDRPKPDFDEGRAVIPDGVRVIGQLYGSYIILEGKDGMIMIDQHAAHEGLLFGRLSRRFSEPRGIGAQPLLFPLVLERSAEDVGGLSEVTPLLRRLGLEVEPFGPSQVAVRTLPDFLAAGTRAETVVHGILDRVLNRPEPDSVLLFREILASMACHCAIKAKNTLDPQEMEALVRQIIDERVTHCPHGRPVALIVGTDEIERRFGRK
jgi:DNA mismatch repair protein MutL